MLLPRDVPIPGPQSQHRRKSLKHLGESIQSLLGSKQDLTFRWAESVRFIIEDLSAVQCESPLQSPRSTLDPITPEDKQHLQEDIFKLEVELEKLRALLKEEDAKRSCLLNKYLDLKGNVRVFCRVRPFLGKEQQSRSPPVVATGLDRLLISSSGKRRPFQLDKVFLPTSSQDDVFAEVGPLVRSALDGHNVCVFAYGQTGAGKTFTMEGTKECPGVVPRTLQLLFHQASQDSTKKFHFTFSMLEVYMGNLRDLLVPPPRRIADPAPKCLSIQMDVKGGVEVENLTEFIVQDAYQASQLYRIGSRARATACTNSNEASSRSHCLIRVTMSSTEKTGEHPLVFSKLWLIDLGGSERLLKTDAKGQVMEEGKAINLSLSALGDVISALQRKQPHIPYRNSKLTQILRDSLGEDAKTVMLVHVSPREEDVGETLCTLGFATRARGIHLGKELTMHEKEERARIMDGIWQKLQEHENSCQYARDNIQELEFLCRKKREMLEADKPDEIDAPKHEVPLLPAISERTTEKKMKSSPADCLQPVNTKPRFMTATASSRLKGRLESNNVVGMGFAKKSNEKSIQVQRRLSYGCKAKAAKVSPMDSSLPSDDTVNRSKQGDPIAQSSGSLSKSASQAKVFQQLAGLKPLINMTLSPLYTTTIGQLMSVMEDEKKDERNSLTHDQQPKQPRRHSHPQQCKKPSRRPMTVTRRQLTVECSGQITMINTKL